AGARHPRDRARPGAGRLRARHRGRPSDDGAGRRADPPAAQARPARGPDGRRRAAPAAPHPARGTRPRPEAAPRRRHPGARGPRPLAGHRPAPAPLPGFAGPAGLSRDVTPRRHAHFSEWVSRLSWAFAQEKRLTRPRRPPWPSARPARAASLTARAPGVTVLLLGSLRRDVEQRARSRWWVIVAESATITHHPDPRWIAGSAAPPSPQQGALDLAARGLRELCREVHDSGVFVRRRLGLHVLLELGRQRRAGLVAVAQDDDSAHDLAAFVVGCGDGRGLGDGGV